MDGSITDYTRTKLASSTLLLTGLQEERTRWIQEAEESHAEADPLAGDAGIASAMMVYLGPFGRQDRADLLQSLSGLCQELFIDFSQELHVPKFYTTQNEISSWFVQGLPCDEFSIQNGMLALHCARFPLIIDPQDQCGRWIQRRENCPIVNDYTSPGLFSSTVSDCIAHGRALIYEGIETAIGSDLELLLDQIFLDIDDTLDSGAASSQGPVTGKRLFWKGKELEWHPNFRIFFVCSLVNPQFDAQLSARTTIVNFSMTMAGLEDQLLNVIVKTVDPDLEKNRLAMLTDINVLRKEMDDLDKTLLQELSESEGNLLDNDPLMETLSEIKVQLQVVDEKLLEAEESEADVLKAYDDFRAVAARASLLYFALQDMARMSPMYQVSMSLFDDIFTKALHVQDDPTASSASIPLQFEERMLVMSNNVTSQVLKRYALCYAQKHQAIFELSVALRLGMTEQQWENPDFLYCLSKCGSGLEISLVQRKPKDWIPDAAWLNLVCLADRLPRCRSFLESMVRKENLWKTWFDAPVPEAEGVPEHEGIEPLYKLLLIRAVREDRILAAAREYFVSVLGEGMSGQSGFDIQGVWKLSAPARPIIIHSEVGVDPTSAILLFAKKRNTPCTFMSVCESSMAGDISPMRATMSSAYDMGSWVVLQNAHLASASDLERQLAFLRTLPVSPRAKPKRPGMYSEQVNVNEFRLWITSQGWDHCPTTLILRSVRAPYAVPTGVRESMLRLYSEQVLPEQVRPTEDRAWARQVYCLSVCYSIMLQRCRYGATAWSMPFDLDIADWSIAASYLKGSVFEPARTPSQNHGPAHMLKYSKGPPTPTVLNLPILPYFS